MTRILVAAHVIPGQPVESILLNMSHVVRHQILSPSASRSFTEPHNCPVVGLIAMPTALRIPEAVDFDEFPFRSVFQNIGAMEFGRVSVDIVYIGCRSLPRRTSAFRPSKKRYRESSDRRQTDDHRRDIADNLLRLCTGFNIPVLVRIADN